VIYFPWKARKTFGKNWELYDIQKDRGENKNLANQNPEKLSELISEQKKWAGKTGVIDWAEVSKTPMVWE
jgi:arylsulfatase